MTFGLAALSASVFAGLDLPRACGPFFRAPRSPAPLQASGFGFTLARITSRPSRTRFAGRLNSGVSPYKNVSPPKEAKAIATAAHASGENKP